MINISRKQIRSLIIEELKRTVEATDPRDDTETPVGTVSIGWRMVTPLGLDLPGKALDIPTTAHAFIRMERYGKLPSWWPSSNSIITLSGFSEFYAKNWKKIIKFKQLGISGKTTDVSYAPGLPRITYPTLNWGRLQKMIDWPPDMPGKEAGLRKISIPSSLSVDEVQKRILDAFQLYGENDHYDPMAMTGRNSNSLVFSVLKSALGDKFKLATDKALLPGVNFPGWGFKVSGL